jgi:hypothetical protein
LQSDRRPREENQMASTMAKGPGGGRPPAELHP